MATGLILYTLYRVDTQEFAIFEHLRRSSSEQNKALLFCPEASIIIFSQ